MNTSVSSSLNDDTLGIGRWLFLKIDNNEIAVFIGCWGRQVIYVNEQLMSDIKSSSQRHVHTLAMGQRNLRVVVSVERFLDVIHKIECQLLENDDLLAEEGYQAQYKTPFKQDASFSYYMMFIFLSSFVPGFVVAFLISHYLF